MVRKRLLKNDIVKNINSTEKDLFSKVSKILEELYENNYLSSDRFQKKMENKQDITVNRYYTKQKLYNTQTKEILEDINV